VMDMRISMVPGESNTDPDDGFEVDVEVEFLS
jgi:hypothetical protein